MCAGGTNQDEKSDDNMTEKISSSSQSVIPSSSSSSTSIDKDDDIEDDKMSQATTTSSSTGSQRYSLRTRLREETEAPFRKARMFVYGGSAISAGVGGFISSLRIIASLTGVRGVQPLSETLPNVGVDVLVIIICVLLLRFETAAGDRRLRRMSRGATVAALRTRDCVTEATNLLKDRRGKKRVVVIAGEARGVRAAVTGAEEVRERLDELEVEVIPFVMNGEDGRDGTEDEEVLARRGWRTLPVGREDWRRWFESERDAVKKGKISGDGSQVLVVIVRLDGKVGARSVGAPLWPRLVEEVGRLPRKDQYGMP